MSELLSTNGEWIALHLAPEKKLLSLRARSVDAVATAKSLSSTYKPGEPLSNVFVAGCEQPFQVAESADLILDALYNALDGEERYVLTDAGVAHLEERASA